MNNIHPFYDRETIAAEAREWLIRLDDDTPPTDGEIRALREWAGRSPAHRQELKRLSRFWDSANILMELAIPLHKPRAAQGLFSQGRLAAVAATCLLAVGAVLLLANLVQPNSAGNGIYGTAIGQQRTVALPDDSVIELNTDSQVEVAYDKTARKVRLLRGESLFEVTPDPALPFEVYARGHLVKAIGTAFSVRLLEDDVQVTVAEGKVELIAVGNNRTAANGAAGQSGPQRLGFLERGQSTTFNRINTYILTLAEQDLARRLAWRDGFLSFSGEPLAEVVREINRYTPRTIEIADPHLATLPVGGRFRVNDLDAMFDVLKTSFGIQSERIGDQRILLRTAKKPL